jgi:retron-type reverse transcriptase
MTTAIFQKYFSPENLRLAWERVIRSNGKDVKDFFGMEIYSANLDKNLSRLSDIIINGKFEPQRPFKYYEPKASKTHRTKSVLSIDDALVYQAIVNIVAANNYKTLSQNNSFVFGSVLHPEVEKGIGLLNSPDAQFYFFEYYLPLYNKFIDSVNLEIGNTNIQYKLETDITGFFDSIPHSKLLMTLHKFGVETEILDLLKDCLNIYSGTRDSVTPGVGIPQGLAASFFLANTFLYELDYLISQKGYTYYRYMDDIRIYEETEEKIIEVLILIDNYLKGRALSLNTKKTSIERIGDDRDSEKSSFLTGYGESDLKENADNKILDFAEQELVAEAGLTYKIPADKELEEFCRNEIATVENVLKTKFQGLGTESFDKNAVAADDSLKKEIIHIAYRWRHANAILTKTAQPVLNPEMIPVWIACVEIFFWKANHFCWNLNQYGDNKVVKSKLIELMPKFANFEWVRYQILSNMAFAQQFHPSELKRIFRKAKDEPSPLVRLGYYTVVLKHLDSKHQLFASLRQAIKDDTEPYIRTRLFSVMSGFEIKKKIDELKFWFGL